MDWSIILGQKQGFLLHFHVLDLGLAGTGGLLEEADHPFDIHQEPSTFILASMALCGDMSPVQVAMSEGPTEPLRAVWKDRLNP